MSIDDTSSPFTLPRRIREGSPWWIAATVGDPLAGVYTVEKDAKKRTTTAQGLNVSMVEESYDVRVYDNNSLLPAYVVKAIEAQHNAYNLADVYTNRTAPRIIIERDGFMLRVFIVTAHGLANVTGYLAKAYGFRLRDRSGGRRWIALSGGGYSPEDHAADALAYVLGLNRSAVLYDTI